MDANVTIGTRVILPRQFTKTMDGAHLLQLLSARKVSEAQHRALVALVEEGVTDPCVDVQRDGSPVPHALIKLWYKHLPRSQRLGNSIADVRDMILKKGKATVHYTVASKLGGEFAACPALDAYLAAWLGATDDVVILEAIVCRWLEVATVLSMDSDSVEGRAISVAAASADPQLLLELLAEFKRQFKLTAVHPRRLVDALALARGWWTKESTARADVFVRACVEEHLTEDEWVARQDIVAHVDELSSQCIEDSLERLASTEALVHLPECDGITVPSLYYTSRCVKRLIKTEYEDAASPWTDAAWTDDKLTDEQDALVRRVVSGQRLTLCASPAGTGKTHTAAVLAAQAPSVLCLAPTWKAISILRGKLSGANVVFLTVQGFCMLETPPVAELVLVDETSMLTMRHLKVILQAFAHHHETRILFLGDDAQLPCIGRGFPIRDIRQAIPTLSLTKCMRTHGSGLLAAAEATRHGHELEEWDGEVSLTVCSDPVDCMARFFTDVTGTEGAIPCPWEDTYVQMITPQNNHVALLNEMVQAKYHDPKKELFSKCYIGDAVRIRENAIEYHNGEEGVLVDIVDSVRARPSSKRMKTTATRDGIVVKRDGTRVRVLDKHIEPAYATTVHRVQGSEYSAVALVLFRSTHPNLQTREMLYTSVTRAKCKLYVLGHLSSLPRFLPLERRTLFRHV